MKRRTKMSRKHRADRIRKSSVESLEQRYLFTTYYVDNKAGDNGSDSNTGTSLSTPFLTIQRAAQAALPGDTVDIRAGTYRETVTPKNSGTAAAPITYQAYNNEKVVIDGADLVTGWTSYSGNIYQSSSMNWTMGGQDDQLFVDGQMMTYARWPNTSLDVSHPSLAVAGANTTGVPGTYSFLTETIYDTHLTQPAGYWIGATIHVESGAFWVYEAATITNYTRAVINGVSYGVITYQSSFNYPTYYTDQPGNVYYITGDPYFTAGQFQNLDSAGEFYRDPTTGKVYLWTPAGDSPSSHVVEAKAREWAFDLSGDSYINIVGINIFAAGINSSSSSNHLLINGITAQYVSHFENYNGNWLPTFADGSSVIGSTGIVLDGGYDTIENSTIAYSAGDGIFLGGSNNTVFNNVIHDVDYLGLTCAGIDMSQATGATPSANNDIGYNTLYNSGRVLIQASSITTSRIHNNRLWNAMLQATDGGAIYAYGANGNGTEIDHNVISNVFNAFNYFSNGAVFLDGGSNGFTIDHNIIYNATEGFKSYDAPGNSLINNTIVNTLQSIDIYAGDNSGVLENNIALNGISVPFGGMLISNNIQAPTDPLFVSPSTGNYQLQAKSPAIDTGTAVSPYTNGYVGAAPDIGALEYGAVPWSYGSSNLSSVLASVIAPAPWTSQDIGSPAVTGSTSYANGTFTLSGSGTDIWNSADQFQFASVPVSGNQTMVARVIAQSYTSGWAKAGLMFRSSTAANSAFIDVVQTPENGVVVCARDASGNLTLIRGAAVADPVWLKLSRSGNVFTAYDSVDGINWSVVGSVTITLPSAGLMGLAVTSVDPTTLSTATFDNVSLQPTAPAGLAATAVTQNTVTLAWNSVVTATGYQIQRSSDGVNYSTIATTGAVTSYSDNTGLSAGTKYFYRILAMNGLGSSPVSSAVSATTLTLAPTAVTAVNGQLATTLSWTAPAGAVSYKIYRGLSSGAESLIASGVTSTTYSDSNVQTGVTYYYFVTAVNSNPAPLSSESAGSTEVSVNAGVITSVPAVIQTANYDLGGEGVAYHDTDSINQGGAYRTDGVDVEGAPGSYDIGYVAAGEWLNYTISVPATGYYAFTTNVASPLNGATFHFEIDRANVTGSLNVPNTGWWGTYTNVTSGPVLITAGLHVLRLSFDTAPGGWVGNFRTITVAVTNPPAPAVPLSVTAVGGATSISLSWTAGTNDSTYNVYRSTTPGGEGATPLVTGLTTTSYTDTATAIGVKYYYTVTGVNGITTSGTPNESSQSTEVSATITTVKITGTPIGTTASWNNNGDTIAQVFDGNFNTFYDAPNGNLTQWVGLDMGFARNVTQIQYAPRAGYESRMINGQFQVSNTADFSSGVVTLATITSAPVAGQFTVIAVNPGASYRYIRYVGGSGWVNIAEMEVDGTAAAAPASVKLTGTVIGTSTSWNNNGDTIAQVFDGDFTTYFDAANSSLSNWVGLDLGTAKTITQIKYAPRAGYEYRMIGGMFQVSTTADFSSNVTTIYTITAAPVAGQFTTVSVSVPAQYRYIRYVGGTQWVNIAEMEVDGTGN
jgi:parallel beta-helix repeat protein